MLTNNKKSLLLSLSIDVAILGVVGLLLVLVTGKVYHDLSYNNHRTALGELVELSAHDQLLNLESLSKDLGLTFQTEPKLRSSIRANDTPTMTARLDNQFQQYFVTAGVARLQKLVLFTPDFAPLAASREGVPLDIARTVICPHLIDQARAREGPDRLKPISQMCAHEGMSYFSIILPVGGLVPQAYLQVLTDPAYSLTAMESALGLPLLIHYPDGEVAYQSSAWPNAQSLESYLVATAQLRDPDSEVVLSISVARDIAPLRGDLLRSSMIVAGVAILAIAIAVLFVIFKLKRGLRPLTDLRAAAENLRKGQYTQVTATSYPEIDVPVHSFNMMASEISELIHKLEQEIEERKKVESELKTNQVALQLARDQAFSVSHSKTVFLANMSHELRTPLNAIIGYSELLQEDLSELDNHEWIEDLGKINHAGRHLLHLVNEVLDLSKIEAGKMELHIESFDIFDFVRHAIDTIRPSADRNNNKVILNCPANIGSMSSDLTKIQQCLLNLLGNASKFTHNGTITVNIAREKVSNTEWISFSVADTGIGISKDQLKKLFSEFVQADTSITKKYGGTGLGLVLSKRLCELLGGYISVRSELGTGSTFAIYLPPSGGNMEKTRQALQATPL